MPAGTPHLKWEIHPDFTSLKPFLLQLPERFSREGEIIYKGRNELRLFHAEEYNLVVKSYRKPHLLNRFVYRFLRSSKAERAYRYGLQLLQAGIGTPAPVGYLVCHTGLLTGHSFSVSLQSECPHLYKDFYTTSFPRQEEILEAIARTTARLHEQGMLHKDYSEGNILFDDSQDPIPVELIDLNRMVFGNVSLEKGCKNFERLLGDDTQLAIMGRTYAQERHFDPPLCIARIQYHVHQRMKALEK